MRLMIDISEEDYDFIKTRGNPQMYGFKAIQNGVPLDKDSERAEVQAYFDGQAYGWEEGRKALIDDVKAEIEKLKCYVGEPSFPLIEVVNVETVLEILNNIGKESEE